MSATDNPEGGVIKFAEGQLTVQHLVDHWERYDNPANNSDGGE